MKRLLFRGGQAFQVVRWPVEDRLTSGVGGVSTREEEAHPEDPAPSRPPTTASNWFKLQVLDDDSGKPVEGVSVELRLPGSESRKYTTDGQGKIQVNDLQEGVADILSVSDQVAWEVVSLD